MGDRLFPIAAPPFLWIHAGLLYQKIGTVDTERGREVATYLPVAVRGYLTAPDAKTDDSAGTQRVRIDAVLALPSTVNMTGIEYFESDDSQLPPSLAGRYRVEVVRSTIVHTRVLLSRFTGSWTWS